MMAQKLALNIMSANPLPLGYKPIGASDYYIKFNYTYYIYISN